MASYLYTCVICVGQARVSGKTEAPPEFDHICDSCKAKQAQALVRARREAERAATLASRAQPQRVDVR